MDSITWPAAALAFATIALVLSNVGNEISRRRKFKRYADKILAEIRSPDPEEARSPSKGWFASLHKEPSRPARRRT